MPSVRSEPCPRLRALPLIVACAVAGLTAQTQRGERPKTEQAGGKQAQGREGDSGGQKQQDASRPKTADEDELKSAFVLQFARYVTWTKDALRGQAELTIAVVGDDELGATMATLLKDKKVDDRPIKVTNLGAFVKLTDKATLKRCQVLVFAGDDAGEWAAIRTELDKSAVLTISSMPGFAKQGGMIELYPDGKTLRFDVVQKELAKVELTASSKLLRLSQPRPDPPPGEVRK